jgi:hypothetical protein
VRWLYNENGVCASLNTSGINLNLFKVNIEVWPASAFATGEFQTTKQNVIIYLS